MDRGSIGRPLWGHWSHRRWGRWALRRLGLRDELRGWGRPLRALLVDELGLRGPALHAEIVSGQRVAAAPWTEHQRGMTGGRLIICVCLSMVCPSSIAQSPSSRHSPFAGARGRPFLPAHRACPSVWEAYNGHNGWDARPQVPVARGMGASPHPTASAIPPRVRGAPIVLCMGAPPPKHCAHGPSGDRGP